MRGINRIFSTLIDLASDSMFSRRGVFPNLSESGNYQVKRKYPSAPNMTTENLNEKPMLIELLVATGQIYLEKKILDTSLISCVNVGLDAGLIRSILLRIESFKTQSEIKPLL